MNKNVVQTFCNQGGAFMRKNENKKSSPNVLLNMAVGGITGLVTAMVLLLLLAILTSTGYFPEKFMKVATVFACGIGEIIGSLTASKRQRGKRLITGIGSGIAMFLLTIILATISGSGAIIGSLTPSILISILIGGLLGSLLCAAPGKVRR